MNNPGVFIPYQSRVLSYSEIVPYDQIVMSIYHDAIPREPMIGIKVLLRDTRAYEAPSPMERIRYISSGLPQVLAGTGCCLRESRYTLMRDGFWLIAFPVPRSQISRQIANIISTINKLSQFLGFVCTGMTEICISGRLQPNDLMYRISRVEMPDKYLAQLVKPDSGSNFISYNFGCLIPINQCYTLVKTRWKIDPVSLQYDGLRDTIEYVSFKLSNIFY